MDEQLTHKKPKGKPLNFRGAAKDILAVVILASITMVTLGVMLAITITFVQATIADYQADEWFRDRIDTVFRIFVILAVMGIGLIAFRWAENHIDKRLEGKK